MSICSLLVYLIVVTTGLIWLGWLVAPPLIRLAGSAFSALWPSVAHTIDMQGWFDFLYRLFWYFVWFTYTCIIWIMWGLFEGIVCSFWLYYFWEFFSSLLVLFVCDHHLWGLNQSFGGCSSPAVFTAYFSFIFSCHLAFKGLNKIYICTGNHICLSVVLEPVWPSNSLGVVPGV